MIKKLSLLPLLFVATLALSKSPNLSQMSEADKQTTGLHKLSEEELSALKAWINNEQVKIDRKMKERNAGFENRQSGDKRAIRAILDKSYTDKLGHTYYELDNGQIWKKVSSGSINMSKGGRQTVTIKPGVLGSWQIKGDGNSSVKVKRIK